MDKHTLSNYGFLLVATILIAALLAVLSPVTPFGDYVRSSINEVVDTYIEKTKTEDIKNENNNITPSINGENVIRKITINLLYEDGKQIQEPLVIEIKHGESFNVQDKLPKIYGYTPTNIPKENTIKNDETYNVVYIKDLYSIEYVTNGGTILSTKPMSYLYGETIELPTNIIKEGYYFAGWYLNDGLSGNKLYEITPQIKGDITLYAKWEKNAYKITYISNGTEITNIANKYKTTFYGESTVLPTLTAQGGKNFGGWYTNKYFEGNNIVSTPQYPTENLTYYAYWTNDGYSITYVTNDGIFDGTYPTIYTSGQKAILPTNISKVGYVFDGWYTDSSYKTKVTEIKDTEYGNKTFYAKWKYQTYNITYDLNGGSATGELQNSYTFNPTQSPLKYNTNVSKDGYFFVGWKDTNLNEIQNEIGANRYGDIHLVAQYSSVTYNITYNANGGLPDNTMTNIKYGNAYGEGPIVNRDGYIFDGWYTHPTDGTKIETTDIFEKSSNQTLYAHWKNASYNIHYIQDGGTFKTTPINQYTFGTETTIPTNISKEKYTFDGWYNDDLYSEKIEKITASEYGDKTVFAKWIPAIYNIVYDTQGGEIQNDNSAKTYTYGEGLEILPLPVKPGYSFVGWKMDGEFVNSIMPYDFGDKTLIAEWNQVDTFMNIVLLDSNGNDLYNPDGTKLCYSQPIMPDTNYEFTADYFTKLYNINEIYYHNNLVLNFSNEECISNDFSVEYELTLKTYRILNVKLYYDDEEIELDDSTDFKPIYRFKQSADEIATLEIPESLNGGQLILNDNGLNGKTIEEYINNGNTTLSIKYTRNKELVWVETTWDGLTDFFGSQVWNDGTNIYYSYTYDTYDDQYILDKSTLTWIPKTWDNIPTSLLRGGNIWTDGTNIYHSFNNAQYILNDNTWEEKTWDGLTKFYGSYIWTDGTNYYYSYANNQYILNNDVWEWNSNRSSIYGCDVWTDGTNIYYSHTQSSSLNGNYILDKTTSTWNKKTWNGLTEFWGNYIWTDGTNIYYSHGTDQYILDVATSTWVEKTWNGLTSFDADYIWTDGTNYYYSNGKEHYMLIYK